VSTNYPLVMQREVVIIISNGSNWLIVG
jgi:hypothetical protein